MKKQNRRISLIQHIAISGWLNNPTVLSMSCDIPNAYGPRSKAGKTAVKIAALAEKLKSEMEEMAHQDGLGSIAMNLYYPPAP